MESYAIAKVASRYSVHRLGDLKMKRQRTWHDVVKAYYVQDLFGGEPLTGGHYTFETDLCEPRLRVRVRRVTVSLGQNTHVGITRTGVRAVYVEDGSGWRRRMLLDEAIRRGFACVLKDVELSPKEHQLDHSDECDPLDRLDQEDPLRGRVFQVPDPRTLSLSQYTSNLWSPELVSDALSGS